MRSHNCCKKIITDVFKDFEHFEEKLPCLVDGTELTRKEFQYADKVAPEGIFGAKFVYAGREEEVICKFNVAGLNRNVEYEKNVYAEIQKGRPRGATGCVFMFETEGPSLVIEDFGTDIRPYLNSTSTMLRTGLHQLAEAVNALHTCGYVHGDLKPHNFLCKVQGLREFKFKLCDLDSATKIGEIFKTSKFTELWVSPEVYLSFLDGKDIAARASMDMFNFGHLAGAILHSRRYPNISLLPEPGEELVAVFKDEPRLHGLMPCGGRLDYKFWVDKMCR